MIWDCSGTPPIGFDNVIFWSRTDSDLKNPHVSIPVLVEKKALQIRKKFLAWSFSIGQKKVFQGRFIEYFNIRPGLSLWWTFFLQEKCNWSRCPGINDALKILAFEDWALGKSFSEIVCCSDNTKIVKIFQHWAHKKSIRFQPNKPVWCKGVGLFLFSYISSLSHLIQAFIWLLWRISERWSFREIQIPSHFQGQITFISYLVGTEEKKSSYKGFQSGYWGKLPQVLAETQTRSNWIHLYVKTPALPNVRKAIAAIQNYNASAKGMENHAAIESFFSFHTLWRILRDWIWLLRKSYRLRGKKLFSLLGEFEVWPLFQEDWRRSVYGKGGMETVYYLNLFESVFKKCSSQKMGIYLQENHPWEICMQSAWKRYDHGKLFGYPHSTVCFWDMRYFQDPRCFKSGTKLPMPRPHGVALNGPAGKKEFLKGGYPSREVLEVEALRYLYLAKRKSAKGLKERAGNKKVESTNVKIKMLVLTDYTPLQAHFQMTLLEGLETKINRPIQLTVRCHPAFPICQTKYPKITFSISQSPLEKLLHEANLVYTSNMTSAAVEAFCFGKPVIVSLSGSTPNLSPLRTEKQVDFVSSTDELAAAILRSVKVFGQKRNPAEIFHLEPHLPRWRKLLKLSSTGRAKTGTFAEGVNR